MIPLLIACTLTIHIYGDSIAKGYGLATFDNPSPLNSIWGIGNLLTDCGQFRYGTVEPIRDNSIWQAVQTGVITGGDVVVFENAGPHFDNTEYYRMWLKLIKFQTTHRDKQTIDVRVLFGTTPDYEPKSPAFYNSNYDEIVDSGLSINDVVRQEAGGDLVDWNAEMDKARTIMAEYGASPMLPDNVHPNAFGNYVMALAILRKLGLPVNIEPAITGFQAERNNFPAIFGNLNDEDIREILRRLAGIEYYLPVILNIIIVSSPRYNNAG